MFSCMRKSDKPAPKRGGVRYPWLEWFGKVEGGQAVTLRRGKHYTCTTIGMMINARNALSHGYKHLAGKVRIALDPNGGYLTLSMKTHGNGTPGELWESHSTGRK